MRKIKFLLLAILLSACSCEISGQTTLDFLAPGSAYDKAANTNASLQQVIGCFGDSWEKGTAHQFSSTSPDKGPEPSYASSAYYYSSSTITEFANSDLPNATYGSWWPTWADLYYKVTSRKAVITNMGAGGSEFYPNGDNNNWYTSGTLYAAAVAEINAAMAAVGVSQPRMLHISCGINDARGAQSLANIESAIYSLVTRLQADFPGAPIIFNKIPDISTADPARTLAINGYIQNCTTLYSNVHIATDLGQFEYYIDAPTDLLHLKQIGNELVGAKMIKDMRDKGLIANKPITRTYTSTVNAVINSMPVTPTERERRFICDMVSYLDRKSYWTNLASFYWMDMANENNSKQDWIRSSKTLNKGSGATWVSGKGFQTDGTITGALGTNFIPSTDEVSPNISAGNCFFFTWIDTVYTSGLGTVMGAIGSTSSNQILITQKSDNSVEYSTNSATVTQAASSVVASNGGMAAGKVSTSAQTLLTTFEMTTINGTSANTTAYPDREIYLGALNNNGTIQQPFSGVFKCFFVSPGVTSVTPTHIYKKIRELRNALYYGLYD